MLVPFAAVAMLAVVMRTMVMRAVVMLAVVMRAMARGVRMRVAHPSRECQLKRVAAHR
jgi:hypothetical protein